MKVLLFNTNKDEEAYINTCNESFKFCLTLADFDFNKAGMNAFMDFDGIWITTNCKITKDKAVLLKEAGIKYIVSRAAGTDHMDLEALRKAGIKAANVPLYSPHAIAEHTLCLILMCLRKMKRELAMISDYDFSLNGLKGRELRNMTAGVIGTGRIGTETIKLLKGFGCRILAYDIHRNPLVEELVSYVSLEEIFQKSDIIILHCPLTKENEKIINSNTLTVMKDGAVLINTARGGLVDYKAVLRALEEKKLSALAFDVYDQETPYIRKKAEIDNFKDKTLRKLMERENVIYTAHMSFYTETAIENMIMTTFENLYEYAIKEYCSNEVTR